MTLDEVLKETAIYCMKLLAENHEAENAMLIDRACGNEPNILAEYNSNTTLLIRFQQAPK